jgi:hypothetical protein
MQFKFVTLVLLHYSIYCFYKYFLGWLNKHLENKVNTNDLDHKSKVI